MTDILIKTLCVVAIVCCLWLVLSIIHDNRTSPRPRYEPPDDKTP